MEIKVDMNPWDYLDGTNIDFAIEAGGAEKELVSLYHFISVMGLAISTILILAAIIGIIYTSAASNRAQRKQVFLKRIVVMFVIGLSTSFLTLLMTLCNIFFGVA